MQQKHKFVFEYMGGVVTAYKTQEEIADMLKIPDVKLISVNDRGAYTPKRKKVKQNGNE